jgi:hypothetical protein
MNSLKQQPILKSLSFWALIIGFLIISIRVFQEHRWKSETSNGVLTFDVLGYYLYLPATFIYKDVKKLSFKDSLVQKYQLPGDFYQAYDGKSGNKVFKYSAGTAAMYLPFFAIGHFVAKLSDYPADGFSLPYQIAISLGGVLIVFLGGWFTRLVLLRYFKENAVAISILILLVGTNYYQYASFDYTSPHTYLFFLMALLFWVTIKFYEDPDFKKAALLGIICGLAALMRPTDAIFIFIPLFWKIADRKSHFIWLSKQWKYILVSGLVMGSIGFIQLAYWKYAAGTWLEYSYEDQGFSFLSPHFPNVLFSYRKGWFIYTPLMLISVFGLIPLFKKWKNLFWPILILFAFHLWIVASWDIWWYGGGWGQRAMIDIYPALAFPIAAAFQYAFSKKILTPISLAITGFGIFLNLFMTHQGAIDTEYTSETFFKKVFLNWNIKETDYLLQDTDEYFEKEATEVKIILQEGFENLADTSRLSRDFVHNGDFSTYVGPSQEFCAPVRFKPDAVLKDFDWIRCKAWFFTPEKDYGLWTLPQFTVSFNQKGQNIKSKFVRVHRILNSGEWKEISFSTKIPDQPFDEISIHLYNSGSSKVTYMDDLVVEGIKE